MIRIAISGASGRMGRALLEHTKNLTDIEVVFGVDTFSGDLDYPVFNSFDHCILDVDVVVDFSNPSALDGILNYAEKTGAKVVLATTGHSVEQMERIKYSSKRVAIFHSANMSLGVNLACKLVGYASRFLTDYDVEIVETHHHKKIDAPSGTALALAKEINKAKDNSLDIVVGRSNGKRSTNDLTIHSVRGGTVAGKHSVAYFGTGENLTISHEAENKDVFAKGALSAVRFLMSKETGLYGMNDLLADAIPAKSISTDTGFSLMTIPVATECDCTEIFKIITKNNLRLDEAKQSLCEGNMTLSLAFKENKSTLNSLFLQWEKSIESASKIIVDKVENNGVIYDILVKLKAVGAKVCMLSTSQNSISIFVDDNTLIPCVYTLKSYFNL